MDKKMTLEQARKFAEFAAWKAGAAAWRYGGVNRWNTAWAALDAATNSNVCEEIMAAANAAMEVA